MPENQDKIIKAEKAKENIQALYDRFKGRPTLKQVLDTIDKTEEVKLGVSSTVYDGRGKLLYEGDRVRVLVGRNDYINGTVRHGWYRTHFREKKYCVGWYISFDGVFAEILRQELGFWVTESFVEKIEPAKAEEKLMVEPDGNAYQQVSVASRWKEYPDDMWRPMSWWKLLKYAGVTTKEAGHAERMYQLIAAEG